ncbi:amidohydrolase [Pseudomonadota bacterium]
MNKTVALFLGGLSLMLSHSVIARDFNMFSLENERCYDRKIEPYTFVVDSHNHFRPFGGPAIPFDEMLEILRDNQIYFVNIFGIGQKLPAKSPCTYYLDCPGTPVTPSMTNDFVNATNISVREPNRLPDDLHLTLSMSYTDLARPESVVQQIELLDKEFPNMFSWMGEINVVKQALFHNQHRATPEAAIPKWQAFMEIMQARNIPVSLHSDLGNNKEPTKYLYLMEKILETYPDNVILWHHLGLSKELTKIKPKRHIGILKNLLDKNPNLYLDISWRVIYDYYFKEEKSRNLYVNFFNQYSTRILPGTDFVAAASKTPETYKEEVEVNSEILKYLNDKAFRNIALGQNYFNLLGLPHRAPQICLAKK